MSEGPEANPVTGASPLGVTVVDRTGLAWCLFLAAIIAGFTMVLIFTLLVPTARITAAH